MNNVDLRLLDRFRIAQRVNRQGADELRGLEMLRADIEEQRQLVVLGRKRLADVIEFPPRI